MRHDLATRLPTCAFCGGGKPATTIEFHKAVCVLGRKLAKGVYYNETGCIFPSHGCLILNWFTNVDPFS
jgi:hypothetical protein